MTQNPIRTVLSTLSTRGVRYLLMGGQACIFYGAAQVEFWLEEARTPRLLVELAHRHPVVAARLARDRPLLGLAAKGDEAALEAALDEETRLERARDRDYWRPLIRELEEMRHAEARRKHDERGPAPAP